MTLPATSRTEQLTDTIRLHHRALVGRVAIAAVIAWPDAEDAVQHAWAEIAARPNVDAGDCLGYAYVAAVRHARRSAQRTPRPLAPATAAQRLEHTQPPDADCLEHVLDRETDREHRAQLTALPDHQRRELVLLAAGYPHAEIAAACNTTVRAVQRHIARGRAGLRTAAARPS